MKLQPLQSLISLAILLCGVLCIGGCKKDKSVDKPQSPYMTISLQMPGNEPGTYALTAKDENVVTELDVLVFRVDPQNMANEYFLYRVAPTNITSQTDGDANGTTKKYRVKLRQSIGTEQHRIVVIANQRAAINGQVSDADIAVTLKQDLLKRFTFSTADKWLATTTDPNYKPLPMWGESKKTHIITASTLPSNIGTIGMVRALARFDIGLAYNATFVPAGLANFKMAEVIVVNSPNKASGVPAPANFTKDPTSGIARATSPTIPEGTTIIPYTSPQTHTLTTGAKAFEMGLYLPEITALNYGAAPTVAQMQVQFCLVIAGYYSTAAQLVANQPNTTQKTYYRLDIYNRAQPKPQGNLLNILRNHLYKINITDIKGTGPLTLKEALTTTALDFSYKMISWEAGGTGGSTSTDLDEVTTFDPWGEGGHPGDTDVM